jgi:hypothetical protein
MFNRIKYTDEKKCSNDVILLGITIRAVLAVLRKVNAIEWLRTLRSLGYIQ